MLHIERLDVSIQAVGILRGVDMEVPTGKFVGPSAATGPARPR
jgi:Fe-S cluster assembly ATPase SufC